MHKNLHTEMSDKTSSTSDQVPKASCCGSDHQAPKVSNCCEADHQAPKVSSCCGTDGKNASRFDYLFWLPSSLLVLLLVFAVFQPGFLAKEQWLQSISISVYHMVHEVWWGVVFGALSIGILSKIPRKFVGAALGRGGTLKGLFRATFAGVLLDLCSHGILMVAVQLYERGASAGQTVALLIASPWNSFSLTLILVGLIGIEWTIIFILCSAAVAIVTGFVFDRLVARNFLPKNHNQPSIPEDFSFWQEARQALKSSSMDRRLFLDIFWNGIRGSKIVVKWLCIGILLAALLRAFSSLAHFEHYFGPTMLGLAVTIAVATVLEVCSEGSSPIASDIFTRAQAPGNGFAFLMAGVATDYTEVMILRDATKSWKFALCVPLVVLPQVILMALIMNNLGSI